jgi:hypothetical protein
VPTPVAGGSYIYPSPSKGALATVVYWVKRDGSVTLKIYNQTGRLVDTLHDLKSVGWQTSTVSVGKFASGVYYYVLYLQPSSGTAEMQAPHKFVVLR